MTENLTTRGLSCTCPHGLNQGGRAARRSRAAAALLTIRERIDLK